MAGLEQVWSAVRNSGRKRTADTRPSNEDEYCGLMSQSCVWNDVGLPLTFLY